ncbi:MAG: FAD-binding oxidoreductase [Candidatus Aminicenantes bacterium]|nr:FAD-binding oxidoreductase [Candidatus Aminicenantes bacterium]
MNGRLFPGKNLTPDLINRLKEIVGSENVLTDPEKMIDYSHDESAQTEWRCLPEVVVKPVSAQAIASLLKLASENQIPVTPRGGGTGLSGGCIPLYRGIVLSLEKMNKILEIDQVNQMVRLEAGVTLGELIQVAQEAGLAFPPHPGDESAQIGGLIATNAGGSRAVKYGGIRNYVRGLEVVLPSGEIIHLGGKIIKSSSGYNLLHLFIGSEGTLGVITQAIIQLLPAPAFTRSLIIAYEDLEKAMETVPMILQAKIIPLAIEFVEKDVIVITEEYLKKTWPSRIGQIDLLIILEASTEDELDRLSEQVAEVCLNRGGLDVLVAETVSKQQHLLEIRSKIYEAIKPFTVEILDIALPRSEIAAHVRRVKELEREVSLWLPTFGHAGDGNVHTHITKVYRQDNQLIPLPESQWKDKAMKVKKILYEDGLKRGGVLSGEHGIGIIKRAEFMTLAEPAQIEIMKQLKKVFDPKGILNPGKIVN